MVLNYFPCSLIFASFALVTLVSYVMYKNTQVILALMIFGMCVETLSSLLIFIFSCIYSAKGLSETRTLSCVHIVSLLMQMMLNIAVMIQFKVCFKLCTETKKVNNGNTKNSGSDRVSSEPSKDIENEDVIDILRRK